MLVTLGVAHVSSADVVADWNRVALDAIRAGCVPPPRASHLLALAHLAGFDAVNGVRQRYEPYAVATKAPRGVDRDVAYAAAAHLVLAAELPAQAAGFDATLERSLERGGRRRRETSLAWGQHAADVILALRADHGSTIVAPYTPSGQPGRWMPTPPAFAPALLPGWRAARPWCLGQGDALRAPGPPALTSGAYADAFAEVQALGDADSRTRTAEQTEIALFWNDGPGTQTPPGHWNDIARVLSEQQRLTFIQRARLLALLNLGLADAAIVAWDTKYVHDHHGWALCHTTRARHFATGTNPWQRAGAMRRIGDAKAASHGSSAPIAPSSGSTVREPTAPHGASASSRWRAATGGRAIAPGSPGRASPRARSSLEARGDGTVSDSRCRRTPRCRPFPRSSDATRSCRPCVRRWTPRKPGVPDAYGSPARPASARRAWSRSWWRRCRRTGYSGDVATTPRSCRLTGLGGRRCAPTWRGKHRRPSGGRQPT
jgi:hypothetical protein